ncbi:MAG: peptidoglycan-binding protein [Leptolyngbya sp. DLM2.Bin27]|nr:MAG: peptidoglycan-binding protein [Leptolyngbya sp. DLM2.Bin27]
MTTRWLGSAYCIYGVRLAIVGVLLSGSIGPAASLPLVQAEAAPSSQTAAPASPQPLLRPGDRGAEVRQLQSVLAELDFYGGIVDGFYGADTAQAVRSLQQYQGIEVDGIVGDQTWQAVATLERRRVIALPPPMLGAELWTFTPVLVAQPAPPPSAFWLALMPLVPITGGTLTYLKRRVQQRRNQGKPPLPR